MIKALIDWEKLRRNDCGKVIDRPAIKVSPNSGNLVAVISMD